MAMLWLYHCTKCSADWSLLSKRYHLGAHEWGAITYTCFSCQTFLTIASVIDGNSWRTWYQGNAQHVEANPLVLELAREIDKRVSLHRAYTPVTIAFDHVACPTCEEPMSTTPFGDRQMKCPDCGEYAGVNPEPGTIYIV